MSVYDPLAYLRGNVESRNDIRCASPRCGKPISEDRMLYNFSRQELYHLNNNCFAAALQHRTRKSGIREIGECVIVNRGEASELLQNREGPHRSAGALERQVAGEG